MEVREAAVFSLARQRYCVLNTDDRIWPRSLLSPLKKEQRVAASSTTQPTLALHTPYSYIQLTSLRRRAQVGTVQGATSH